MYITDLQEDDFEIAIKVCYAFGQNMNSRILFTALFASKSKNGVGGGGY